jgi:hypothetical protein
MQTVAGAMQALGNRQKVAYIAEELLTGSAAPALQHQEG